MILTKVFANVDEINDLELYHIETCLVKSDDLTKRILRVTSDHGNDYGIRLEDDSEGLENGSAFKIGPKRLVVLSVLPDEVIKIVPEDIDDMGVLAHLLGNLHKPVQVENGQITLLFDPVVVKTLDQRQTKYTVEKAQLTEPLRYVDLTNGK
ncbi:urease accessory protein UreE [Ligilactobacillus faecis]|uniref:Urease accessory protein UreE n=1 Tax=Ligilactobacillus faecis TaxID=762833 RepID=A0ABV4DLN4_9LACO